MPEESTTPDPVERVRRQFEAGNRRDIDAVMSSFAVDAVLEGRALGDTFEGQAAIRAFVEVWFGMYEELAWLVSLAPPRRAPGVAPASMGEQHSARVRRGSRCSSRAGVS